MSKNECVNPRCKRPFGLVKYGEYCSKKCAFPHPSELGYDPDDPPTPPNPYWHLTNRVGEFWLGVLRTLGVIK